MTMCLRKRKHVTTDGDDFFDPSRFGDAVAMQTQWVPMSSGGANFDTHKLIAVNEYRIEFRALPTTYIFFALMTILVAIIIASSINSGDTDACLFLFPIVFFCSFCDHSSQSVFDKRKMLFWKGNAEYDFYVDSHFDKNAKLNNVYAIQLIYKIIEHDDGPDYDNYELNIVLEDSRRIHVVSYAKKDKVRQDASVLARFLDKPIWDAIDLQSM